MPARPLYFVVRPGTRRGPGGFGTNNIEPGAIVPLVALDQLPTWLEIVDVPRALTVEQAAGLLNLGTVMKGSGTFDVRIHAARLDGADKRRMMANLPLPPSPVSGLGTSPGTSPDPGTSPSPSPVAVAVAVPVPDPVSIPIPALVPARASPPANGTAPIGTKSTDIPLPAAPAPPVAPTPAFAASAAHASIASASASASAAANNPPTTAYCRHWAHNGTCRWGPGCRYVHAMPTTPEGLAELGLKTFPAWWTAAAALAAISEGRGIGGGSAGGGGNGSSHGGSSGGQPGRDACIDEMYAAAVASLFNAAGGRNNGNSKSNGNSNGNGSKNGNDRNHGNGRNNGNGNGNGRNNGNSNSNGYNHGGGNKKQLKQLREALRNSGIGMDGLDRSPTDSALRHHGRREEKGDGGSSGTADKIGKGDKFDEFANAANAGNADKLDNSDSIMPTLQVPLQPEPQPQPQPQPEPQPEPTEKLVDI